MGGYRADEEQRGGGSRDFFELASDAQIRHFPAHYLRGLVHFVDQAAQVMRREMPDLRVGGELEEVSRAPPALFLISPVATHHVAAGPADRPADLAVQPLRRTSDV